MKVRAVTLLLLNVTASSTDLKGRLTKRTRVCSLHFANSCFWTYLGSIRLIPGAVPLEYKVSYCLFIHQNTQ
jgi:hypothetical protein